MAVLALGSFALTRHKGHLFIFISVLASALDFHLFYPCVISVDGSSFGELIADSSGKFSSFSRTAFA